MKYAVVAILHKAHTDQNKIPETNYETELMYKFIAYAMKL